jgi:hypothetical protein
MQTVFTTLDAPLLVLKIILLLIECPRAESLRKSLDTAIARGYTLLRLLLLKNYDCLKIILEALLQHLSRLLKHQPSGVTDKFTVELLLSAIVEDEDFVTKFGAARRVIDRLVTEFR